MSDFPRRIATVSIGFPIIWLILSHSLTAWLFFGGSLAIASWEWCGLVPCDPQLRAAYTVTCLLLAAALPQEHFLIGLYVASATWFGFANQPHCVGGLLVLVVPFRAWMQMASVDFGSTISLLLTVWNCDTGALLGGRLAKKLLPVPSMRLTVPRSIQRISPAKSMEGFGGGILLGWATAVFVIPKLAPYFGDTSQTFVRIWITNTFWQRSKLGIVLSVLGILGDLVESSIKRNCGVKDSGKLLPGHGGVLDRFDSTLPAVMFYTAIVMTGKVGW